MKIFYIANARMPSERAHGVQLAKMCEALIKNGTDLTLVVPNRHNSYKESIRDFYGLRCDVPLVKLPVLDVYLWGRVGFLVGSCTFAFSYFFYLLSQKIRGVSYVIYTIDMDQFSFFAIPFLRTTYFVELHNVKKASYLYCILFRSACGLIVINTLIKQTLMDTFSFADDKIIVHHNGIDISFFDIHKDSRDAKKLLGFNEDQFIALYSGKFYKWKGLNILIDAMGHAQKGITLYIIGGTKKELETVTGHAVSERIVCIGHVPFTSVPLWLAAADVLLLLGTQTNDYSYYYTSPMKLFEYMAAKRVIIVSDTPAVRQVVSDEEVVFYTPDSAESLAGKINKIYEMDYNGKLRLTQQAFQLVQQYSWILRAKDIIQFISLKQ